MYVFIGVQMRAYHARALTPLLKIKKNYFIRETISLVPIKEKEGRATWRGELPLYVYVHGQAPKDDTQGWKLLSCS